MPLCSLFENSLLDLCNRLLQVYIIMVLWINKEIVTVIQKQIFTSTEYEHHDFMLYFLRALFSRKNVGFFI